jgi:DNA modification methylase
MHINNDFELKNKDASNFIEANQLPRHRWYYYKEGFSPNLVKNAIASYNLKSNNVILDPFNGSGTVTLTAAERNIPSIGFEVNPFTSFVSKTKSLNTHQKKISELFEQTYEKICKGKEYSELEKYSTFTELSNKKKWLFNLEVLRAFYGGYNFLESIPSNAAELLKLALITSVMDVANAKKDGKCLRYKNNWNEIKYSKNDFKKAYINNYIKIEQDIQESRINIKPIIFNTDVRTISNKFNKKVDLIVTSPPYLNTFDYTDIYRPELFLGKFISNSTSLYQLRLKTIRSHIQVNWKKPKINNIENILLKNIFNRLENKTNLLMHPKIPYMILAYFEDMKSIFNKLSFISNKNAHLWMVVSNSAYANEEIPVDLILADIASKNGWKLQEIAVLREILKRKTKYSPDIKTLRESIIILKKK